jgi:Flp pilus assembly protein TadB
VTVLLAFIAVTACAARLRPRRSRTTASIVTPIVTSIVTPIGSPPRRRRRRRGDDGDLPAAIDLVVLAIHQGLLPTAAIREVAPCTTGIVRAAFETTIARLDAGERFAEAVYSLPKVLGHRAHALADGFAAADRDGLPLAPVLARLADEARQMRRRRVDEQTRRLPVQLAAPLVLCTLPSFALLTVVPMLLAALASLHR